MISDEFDITFNPKLNPHNAKPKQTTGNDWAKPNISQAIVSGRVTNIMAFRRPILSQIGPLNKHPIGRAMYEQLAGYCESDDFSQETRTVSMKMET